MTNVRLVVCLVAVATVGLAPLVAQDPELDPVVLTNVSVTVEGRGADVVVHAENHLWVILGAGGSVRRWDPVADVRSTADSLVLTVESARGATTRTEYRIGGAIDGIAHYDVSQLPSELDIDGFIDAIVSTQASSCNSAGSGCDGGGLHSVSCSVSGCNQNSSFASGCSVTCGEGTYSCCGCLRLERGGIVTIVYTLARCHCCPAPPDRPTPPDDDA